MEPIVFKMSYDVCNPLGRWSACYTVFKKSFPSFVQIHKLNTALSSEQSIAGLHLGIQLFEKKVVKIQTESEGTIGCHKQEENIH